MSGKKSQPNFRMPDLDNPEEVARVVARLNLVATRMQQWDADEEVREAKKREQLAEIMKMEFGAGQGATQAPCLFNFISALLINKLKARLFNAINNYRFLK